MKYIRENCEDDVLTMFSDLVKYLEQLAGVIYITGYHCREFWIFLKRIKYKRKVKLVRWNWQFKNASLIVRFRPDDPIFTNIGHVCGYRGLEREILTEEDIQWEKNEHLQLRGYF